MNNSFLICRRIVGAAKRKAVEARRSKRIKRSKRILKGLKCAHSGERCFIVGNGPSLRLDDLEKIKEEFCFSSHRIYKIFNKTAWRPTYYCAQDYKLIEASHQEIKSLRVKRKFIGFIKKNQIDYFSDSIFVDLLTDDFYPQLPNFSDDPIKGVYEGLTVTYMCLQLAVYMGFKNIYLLGIDHNYSVEREVDGRVISHPSVIDHFDSTDTMENIPQPAKTTLAYQAARNYCENHGISIFNATRGGKLEVYQRVDFDTVINSKP